MGTSSLPAADQAPTPWPAELSELYGDRWEPMVRMATMLLGRRAEAEEVVQDAFTALAPRWGSIDHPPAYLRRTVVNGAMGVLRRRRTAEAHQPDPPPPEAPIQLIELRDVLLALPERQRAVLVLRYVEDLGDQDIAAAIGCRRSTVRSLAARGLAAIREELT